MRKIICIFLVSLAINISTNCWGDEYQTAHQPGLTEGLVAIIRLPVVIITEAVKLPGAVIGGIGQGLSEGVNGRDVVVTNSIPANQAFGQVYYTQPPVIPGYGFNGWYYPQPGFIVFIGNDGIHHWHRHGGDHFRHTQPVIQQQAPQVNSGQHRFKRAPRK